MTRRSLVANVGLAPFAALAATDRPPRSTAAPIPKTWVSTLPNYVLRTQDNKPVRFRDDLVCGKMILFNFFYATCHLRCPQITANLKAVQKLLGERVGKDIVLYSLTLDPATDKPGVLKKYIDEHKIQAGWTFLTGNSDELETLRLMLGFGYRSKAWDSDKSDHAAMVRFGNADLDRWAFCPALSKPQVIADYFLQLDWPKTWPKA